MVLVECYVEKFTLKSADNEVSTAQPTVVSEKHSHSKGTTQTKRTVSQAQWDEIERSYLETTEPLADLAQRYGISFQRIVAYAKKQNWPERRIPRPRKGEQYGQPQRPTPLLSRPDNTETKDGLHARLHNLLAHHIGDAEERLASIGSGAEQSTATDRERDARTLSSLIRTLEKLIELDDRRAADAKSALAEQKLEQQTNGEGELGDAEEMRAELDRRFRRLAELSCKTEMD